MYDIKHFLYIDADPSKVYKAITEQTGLAAWWTVQTIAKPEVGFINQFDFGDRYHNEMKITVLEPDFKVVWECIKGDKEWIGTVLSFELESEGKGTSLRFTHGNWREPTDFMASCNFHWGHYMASLKKLCEAGKGEPFTWD